MAIYTIRELESLSGIKAHTIRMWEKRYGLITPQRTSTNIRTYCDAELKKLLNISILNKNGIKISTIAKLTSEEVNKKITELSGSETGTTENRVEGLSMAMIDMDENTFERLLAKSIIQFGFEETVIRILYPFLKKVGLMWQTGTVNPAQEHFISNLIRQKLFVAIDGLVQPDLPRSKNFVFFLPEGELHEIGLLFMCYLTKKKGHHTIYLGQTMPMNDLMEIIRLKDVHCIVSSVTTSVKSVNAEEYINTLAWEFPDKLLFVGGGRMDDEEFTLPENVKFVNSPLDYHEYLDHIEKHIPNRKFYSKQPVN